MITFDIISIFPDIFDSYFKESILKRAQQKKLIRINIHNLRDWARDKHRKVDDASYGGGPGMVMMVGPIFKAVAALKKRKSVSRRTKIILFSVKGKRFDQKMARQFSKLDQLIMICGRYEGVDERVAKHIADTEISVGDYVLTGGEIPAMIVIDAVSRLVPKVIKEESIEEKRFKKFQGIGSKAPVRGEARQGRQSIRLNKKSVSSYPVYTRPEIFSSKKGVRWSVPKILLSGDHQKIEEWRRSNMLSQSQ